MSPELKALWDRAVAAATRGQEIRKKAVEEKRDMTAEEMANTNKAFEEYRSLKAEVETAVEAEKIKTELEEVVAHPLFGETKGAPSPESKIILPKGSFSEQKAFHAFIAGGLLGVGPELRKDLALEHKAFGVTEEAAGGVLVPEEMANFIISKRLQLNVLRARASVVTVKSHFSIPTFVDESEPAAVAEGGTVTETDVAPFGKILLIPAKHSLLWKIKEELTEDAPAVESFLQKHFAGRCSIYEEKQILNGVGGSAHPFGLLNATFTETHDISGATDDIQPEDFIDARLKLAPAYRNGAVYIVPNLTMIAASKFRSQEGGVGSGQFLWLPSFQLGQPDTILGRPVLECESFADPAADGDCMFLFGDLSTYYIAERTGIVIQRLEELYAASGHVGFRLRWRWDGSPSDENAFARYNRN